MSQFLLLQFPLQPSASSGKVWEVHSGRLGEASQAVTQLSSWQWWLLKHSYHSFTIGLCSALCPDYWAPLHGICRSFEAGLLDTSKSENCHLSPPPTSCRKLQAASAAQIFGTGPCSPPLPFLLIAGFTHLQNLQCTNVSDVPVY